MVAQLPVPRLKATHCLDKGMGGLRKPQTIIKSANWHLTTRCNYNCKFCFSTVLDEEVRDLNIAKQTLEKLKIRSIEKINFVGGEPLLHPLIFEIVKLAKDTGFVVSIVTNGSLLNREVIRKLKPDTDWIGISIDSASEAIEIALGRGSGSHVQHVFEIAQMIHEEGIKLKINTTITRLNWREDMRPLIRKLRPQRWKVFQVLHIEGQNDRDFELLSITDKQFEHFKKLNSEPFEGLTPVFEGNRQMLASYFMISPGGRVMSNMDGANRTFLPLESITDLSQVTHIEQYLGRGALYDWR